MTSQRSDSGNRGTGSMDKEKQREISAKGGRASHEDSSSSDQSSGGTRGGSSEQHAKAGRQSHKNS